MTESAPSHARHGWQSDLPTFVSSSPQKIENSLIAFVTQASPEQQRSWQNSIHWLQREYASYIRESPPAYKCCTVLEYELPRDFRRPDVLVLESGAIVVIEVKGRKGAGQAARDQVSGYARDLLAYHSACVNQTVVPVVVPSDGPEKPSFKDGVWIVGPEGIHDFLLTLEKSPSGKRISVDEFLVADAYAPLPSIVQAARALYTGQELPRIKRARANTDPALKTVTDVAHDAATKRTRHLVLLSGVPGSGKTLVGLQLVHSGWLDDLAVERKGSKRIPAVYLSGNGPLVAVLQDALKGGEAPGNVFVQDIKKYVAYYSAKPGRTPPEHLLVFDEAQRAHDAERVAQVHKQALGLSEPEHLLEFCSRIPEWCVLVALIGDGQAIHAGEEGGVALWREAVERRPREENWIVHAGPQFAPIFEESTVRMEFNPALNLDTEIRFHLTPKVHRFVELLLDGSDVAATESVATTLFEGGHRFLVTQSLDAARAYLLERYGEAPEARFGILASSKDKILPDFGIDNTFQTTKRLKVGQWYNRPSTDRLSCCQLTTVATEFSSQGLELDCALVGWGSDLIRENGAWSIRRSSGTRAKIRDPMQMRKNVYRVLLTRGRDGTVVFVPEHADLAETFQHLLASGFRLLD